MGVVAAEALAKIVATGLAGVFAGAATFISAAQHPALLETDELAFQAPFFRRMYFYAARMNGPMALGSGVGALAVYFLQRDRMAGSSMPHVWLFSGCLMVAIAPFTAVKMLTLNYQLVNSKLCRSRGPTWMQQTLVRWGNLHKVRTGAGLIAFTSMVAVMACPGSAQFHDFWIHDRLHTHRYSNRVKQQQTPASRWHTSYLLVHAPKFVWETKDALVHIADAITRSILRGDLRKTMLETCNRWVADGIETAGDEQPSQPEPVEISAAFSPTISDGALATESAEPDPEAEYCSESPAAPDRIYELNASLVRQIKKLRDDLRDTRANLFHAQRIVARLQEMERIRANRSHVRHNVYLRLSHLDPRLAPRAYQRFGAVAAVHARYQDAHEQGDGTREPAGAHQSLFHSARDHARGLYPVDEFSSSESESSGADSETDSGYQDDHQEYYDFERQHSGTSSVSSSESESGDEVDPLPPSLDPRATSSMNALPAVRAMGDAVSQPPSSGAPRTISYRQLTELNPGEEDGSWHRQALQQLRERRMQRQVAAAMVESRMFSLRNSLEEGTALNEEQHQDPVSYETLASLRHAMSDDETAEWQRQALRYLTEERRRIACQRASASSTSPTNSSTSTLTFVYDD
uniref:Uncharacterized protein n=1 Tax=Globisporangium ultimum (strain ATCC 200006 / CBS 805.95 / DAOM BR144) TaxID=431595 RepID=K3X6A4_GLOUD